jgi:urease accessory protein
MRQEHPDMSPKMRSKSRLATARHGLAGLTLLALSALPAYAHHPTGGAKVTTFAQGLLSGLGHPIIGLDHLMFLLAIGALAALVGGGVRVIVAFMIASFAGVVLHLASVGLPYVEPALAVTILAAGALLIMGGLPTSPAILALAGIGGLLHGYALAESIVGAESTPLAAYLIGLTLIQAALMIIARLVAGLVLDPQAHGDQRLRWFGGAVCLAGAFFLANAVTGA